MFDCWMLDCFKKISGERVVSTSSWAFCSYWETYDLLCWLDCSNPRFFGKLIIYHVWLFSAADFFSSQKAGGASCDHNTSSEAFQSLVLIGKLIICCANDNVLLFSASELRPFSKRFLRGRWWWALSNLIGKLISAMFLSFRASELILTERQTEQKHSLSFFYVFLQLISSWNNLCTFCELKQSLHILWVISSQ